MASALWLLAAPLLFILPGLLPARWVTHWTYCWETILWAFFFSVVLFPPFAFGLAMLFGTTVNAPLLIVSSLVLGAIGYLPRRKGQRA